jgi:hypothetical protein
MRKTWTQIQCVEYFGNKLVEGIYFYGSGTKKWAGGRFILA